jgi:hypothetical protein
MNYNQNEKIAQITSQTLIIGVDSEVQACGTRTRL